MNDKINDINTLLVPRAPLAAPAPMSPANRLVAYSAATRLRELGFEWDATAEAWLQPAHRHRRQTACWRMLRGIGGCVKATTQNTARHGTLL